MALTRRAFAAATAAGVVAPTVALDRKPKAGPQHRKISARSDRSTSICLMVEENGRNGTCIPPPTPTHCSPHERRFYHRSMLAPQRLLPFSLLFPTPTPL